MGELHYFRFLGLLAGQMLNKTQTTAASLLEESAAAFTPGLLALCSHTCHLDFQTELLRRQTLKLELRSRLGRVYFASSFSVVGGEGQQSTECNMSPALGYFLGYSTMTVFKIFFLLL